MKVKSSIFGADSWFYNSEEMNTSLSDLVQEKGFNFFSPEGITSYLSFRYPIGDLTMFKGIKKVPVGCEYFLGGIRTYWYPNFVERNIKLAKSEITIIQMLISIIKDYSNEKIAFILSGGLDSSLLLALYRKLYPKKEIYTYTVGFENLNEFKYAKIVSNEFNTIHKQLTLTKEDLMSNSMLESLILFKGEPLHPNELSLAIVERLAKKDGCTSVMCGEGADDIFGGYSYNLCMYLNYPSMSYDRFMGLFLDQYRYFSLEDRNKIIDPNYLVNDKVILMNYLLRDEYPSDMSNWILYFIQKVHIVGLITRGINAINYNHLKPIFPYINPVLVNYVNSLPFSYKIHLKNEVNSNISYKTIADKHSIPKYILKKVAESYLPEEIVYRRKVAFPVPYDEILRDVYEWELDEDVFLSTDLSSFNGWQKFMLINLDVFIKQHRNYKT